MWDQKKTEQIAGLEKTTGLGEKKLYCGRSVVVFFQVTATTTAVFMDFTVLRFQ